jgi:hypothetical protein
LSLHLLGGIPLLIFPSVVEPLGFKRLIYRGGRFSRNASRGSRFELRRDLSYSEWGSSSSSRQKPG